VVYGKIDKFCDFSTKLLFLVGSSSSPIAAERRDRMKF